MSLCSILGTDAFSFVHWCPPFYAYDSVVVIVADQTISSRTFPSSVEIFCELMSALWFGWMLHLTNKEVFYPLLHEHTPLPLLPLYSALISEPQIPKTSMYTFCTQCTLYIFYARHVWSFPAIECLNAVFAGSSADEQELTWIHYLLKNL